MKEYNFSKKIAAHKQNFNEEGSTQRKKKSKLNKDGIIKQVKKEIKQYIDFSPINNKKKEKVQAKSGSKSFKQHVLYLIVRFQKDRLKVHNFTQIVSVNQRKDKKM